jgi:hypothetical protein
VPTVGLSNAVSSSRLRYATLVAAVHTESRQLDKRWGMARSNMRGLLSHFPSLPR